MKRCSAPCVGKISAVNYGEDIIDAKSYLSSSDLQTIDRLTLDIQKASKELDYEKAADIRDRLKRLKQIREEQSVITDVKDVDIFSIHPEDSYIRCMHYSSSQG